MTFPGGGGSVGDAYIRILADGSNLDDSVRKEFAKHDNAFKEEGARHGGAYQKGFDEESRKQGKANIVRLTGDLRRERGKFEATGALLGGAFGDRVFKAIDEALGPSKNKDLSHRIFANFSEDALRHGIDPALNRLKDFRTAITKATDDIARAENSLDKKTTGFFARGERNLTKLERSTKDFDKLIVRNADNFGKLFGKGSRNNFLNFIGSSIAGVLKLTRVLPNIGARFAELGSEIGLARRQGDGFFRTTARIADVLIQNFVGAVFIGVGAVGALVAALGGLLVIGGPIIAALSAVAAAAVQLAGVISFGLIGALAPLAAILLPVVAGFGVFALAITKLDKNTKKALSNSLRPLTNEFRALQKVAQQGFLSRVADQARIAAPVIARLRPLVRGIADALSRNVSDFILALRGPAFTAFLQTMQTFLPQAIRKLGDIATHVFVGIGGLFRALAPFALDLLDKIDQLANRFADFANSPKGQATITNFMVRATIAAKTLLRFLGGVGDAFFALIDAGNQDAEAHGGGFLQSLTDSLHRFADFLHTGPGQKALTTFFDNARAGFKFLGIAINGIFKLIGALNGPEGQAILHGVFEIVGKIASTVADLLPTVISIFRSLAPLAKAVLSSLGTLLRFFGAHASAVRATAIAFVTIAGALKLIQIGTKLTALASLERFAGTNFGAAAAGLGSLATKAAGLIGALGAGATTGALLPKGPSGLIGSVLLGGLAGFAISGGNPFGAVIGAVGAGLTNFFTHAKSSAKAASPAVQEFFDIFKTGAGDIQEALRSKIALDVLDDKRLVSAASKLGISLKDITDSVLGINGAGQRVGAALDAGLSTNRGAVQDVISSLHSLDTNFDLGKTKADEFAQIVGGNLLAVQSEGIRLRDTVVGLGDAWQGLPNKTVETRNTLNTIFNQLGGLQNRSKVNIVVTAEDRASVLLGAIQAAIFQISQSLTGSGLLSILAPKAGENSGAGAILSNASGRILSSQSWVRPDMRAGEQGREAIVPLNRPLGEVDPSVRWLSAIAQGKGMTNGVGKQINIQDGAIRVVSPNTDPRAVAQELLNTMVAQVNF